MITKKLASKQEFQYSWQSTTNTSLVEIEEKWKMLLQYQACSPSEADMDEFIVAKLNWRRSSGALYRPQYGLGPQLRWSLIFSCFVKQKIKGTPLQHLGEWLEASLPGNFFQLGTLTGYKDAAYKGHKRLEKHSDSQEGIDSLCRLLTSTLKDSYPNKRKSIIQTSRQFTVNDFWINASGPNAVRNFMRFIETGIFPIESNGLLVPKEVFRSENYEPDKLREAILAKVTAKLPVVNNGRPIQCIQIKGSPTDMCAMGHEILKYFESSKEDLRPVLLLPCSRQIPKHNYIGLDFLVYNISNFFLQRPLTNTPPRLSLNEIVDRIHGIKKALAITPAIIVLVGYEAITGDLLHLRRAIRDEPVLELLIQLVNPSVGELDFPIDIDIFQKSNFIVLSDGPINALQSYSREEIVLPPPPIRHHPFLGLIRNVAPEFSDKAYFDLGLDQTHVNPNEATIMGFIQLIRIEKEKEDTLSSLEELTRYDEADVLEKLVQKIRQHCLPLELLLLRIIAIAGAGVRRETLWRCAQIWISATKDFADGEKNTHLSADIQKSDDGAQCISNLTQKFSLILIEGADEPQPELNPLLHPCEYPDYSLLKTGIEAIIPSANYSSPNSFFALSLDFRYPTIREAILKNIENEDVRWPYFLLHEIICEESLRQQILLQRHSDPHIKDGVRSYRRALQALHNGFLSLQYDLTIESFSTWPRVAGASILPSNPIDRFRFLYRFIFHEVLENDKTRRMSLHWGADEVKKDILKLAHSAFRNRGDNENLYSFEKAPVWLNADSIYKDLNYIAQEHYEAIFVVLSRTDDMLLWEKLSRQKVGFYFNNDDSFLQPFHVIDRCNFHHILIQFGPRSAKTRRMWEGKISLIAKDLDLRIFEMGPWRGDDPTISRAPSQSEFDDFLNQCELACSASCQTEKYSLAVGLDRLADVIYQTIDFGQAIYRWRSAMEAYSILLTAARLFVASGHSRERPSGLSPKGIRILARAGLEALRILQNQPDRKNHIPENGNKQTMMARLATDVRRLLDAYALSYSYAPEIVSMLILESRYARTVGSITELDAEVRHNIAMRFLNQAERRMTEFYSRSRLRIRFLIERCATLRGLARARFLKYGETDDVALRYFNLAKMDVIQLDNIITYKFRNSASDTYAISESWRRVVDYQKSLTDEVGKQYLQSKLP